jgi:mono/diheme cytochrome c family protein
MTRRIEGVFVKALLVLTVAMVSIHAQTPARGRGAGQGQTPPAPAPGRTGTAPIGAGPMDFPAVDTAAADRGRSVWAAECITCHGTQARGTDNGPNLIRSSIVLHDRAGSQLGPFLKKGHPLQSGRPSAGLTDAQVLDLVNFLRQRVNDTLRGSPIFVVQNILTGDPKAGEAFFNGEGKCTPCHSVTGNLAGIGGRLSPVDLQQRFLFPGGARGRGAGPNPAAVTVTVTPPSGPAVSGVLVQMDDFDVTLRDASGTVRVFHRGPSVRVVKTDPLEAHHALLTTITDKQIHDVVAYLEKLK